MPLIKSSSPKAVSKNIEELHTGKTYARTKAKFGEKKANSQAIAIALDTARRSARKNGGKVKKYQEGGEVPLWLESGLQETPLEAQIDPTNPNERAALRLRQAQRPPLGRQEGNLGPQMLAAMVPGGLGARAIAAAPKAVALGLAGAGLLGHTSQAGEEEFNWIDPDKDRTARINNFPTLMNNLNREMKAASRARMPSVEKQIDIARSEYEGLLAQRARDRDAARVIWEENKTRRLAEEKAKKERETSIFDKNPFTRAGMAAGAPLVSGLTGYIAGRKLGPAKAAITSGLAGGFEGGLSQYLPNEIDSTTLPPGSPTQARAAANNADPSWWGTRVLPAAGAGAAAGLLGAHYGAMRSIPRRPIGIPERAAAPPMAAPMPSIPEIPNDVASIIGRRPTPSVRRVSEVPFSNREWARQRKLEQSREWEAARGSQPAGSAVVERLTAPAVRRARPPGNYHSYRDPETGRWTRRPPEERASGGRIGYAAGGNLSPTQSVPWTQRTAAHRLSFAGGMLNSKVPGRTDKLNLAVPAGSYVIPSSVVSYLGQDNSMAGAGVLDSMFGMGPGGSQMASRRKFRSPKARFGKRSAKYGFQEGGDVESINPEIPIVAAGGEYVVPPEVLIEKFGDLDHGHKVMDQFVKETRKKHIDTLKKLPGSER